MKNIKDINDNGKWIEEPDPDWGGVIGWGVLLAVVLFSLIKGLLQWIN